MTQIITFPIERTCPFTTPPEYRDIESGIGQVRMSDGRMAWIITSGELARKALADPRLSSEKLRPGFPELSPRGLKALTYFSPFLVNMDGDEHSESRKRVIGEFSSRKMAEFRPKIASMVSVAIDEILRMEPPIDFVKNFSNKVPTALLSGLLGVSTSDLEQIEINTQRMLHGAGDEEEQRAAADHLHAHLAAIIEKKALNPSDDLLSHQIEASRQRHGTINTLEIASLIQLLQVAGHASSAAMISLSFITLFENEDQRRMIIGDPGLIPRVVEELLRYLSITDTGPLRMAISDIELGGCTIQAGDGVVVPTLPANRDSSLYPDPDTFNIFRNPAQRHIAFGFGPHQCLGQNLVRVELEEVLVQLLAQIPSIRLHDPARDIDYRYFGQFFGPSELFVTWDR